MGWPSQKEIAKMRKLLSKGDASVHIPEDAPLPLRVKYNLCKQFVIYLQEQDITQAELALRLEIDPARVSEIIKYKIDLFTIDRLLTLLEKLRPKIKISIA